jgi:hypothetical protein
VQIAAVAVPEQRRSGDLGRPVPRDRRRGRRALASPAAAPAAAEAARRLGQRRRHELAASAAPAPAPAATEHRSCSIITIPSLRCYYDARPGRLGSEEWVPFAGQANLVCQEPRLAGAFIRRRSSTQGKRHLQPLHDDVLIYRMPFSLSPPSLPFSLLCVLDWVRHGSEDGWTACT